MNRFWELLQESVIVQGAVTLILVSTCCYLFATGQEIPEFLGQALMLVLGFYFGSKIQQVIGRKGE